MFVFDTCKKIFLPIRKLQWIIALVAICFGVYPKITMVDGIKVRMVYTDVFFHCSPYTGMYTPAESVECHLRGIKHTFKVKQNGAVIWCIYGGVHTLYLEVSTPKRSKTIKLKDEVVIYNATFPVFSDGCKSEHVDIPIVPLVDGYRPGCNIVNLKSKPELSGELFPVNWKDKAQFFVNTGSVITFYCGENEKQSSTCIGEVKNEEYMFPPIPDNCTTPAKCIAFKTPPKCPPASMAKSITSGSKSIMISETASLIVLCNLFNSLLT